MNGDDAGEGEEGAGHVQGKLMIGSGPVEISVMPSFYFAACQFVVLKTATNDDVR